MTDRRYRALLVGNWHFPDDPANLPDLNGPLNDVAGLAQVLTDPAVTLFHPRDITTLTERTSYQICAAVERFFGEATRNDMLLLYYSGHGLTDDQGALRLTGRDSRFDAKVSTTVSAEVISQMISRCAAAAVVIVLDCCHAGAFKGGDLTTELAGKGRFVLAASRSRQRAPDAEYATGMSRFTGHLLRGMRGAAALPGAEHLTVTDLYQYVRRKMAEEGPIIPQWRFDGEGDPALARTPTVASAPQSPPALQSPPAPQSPPALAPPPVLSSRPALASPAPAPAATAPTVADLRAALLQLLKDYQAAVPGMQVDPPTRTRVEKNVRRLGGVSDREHTLATVGLSGGPAIVFTDAAMYWMDKDRGVTVPLAYRAFPARTFRVAAAVAGMPPTHVDLGDGIPRFAGAAAPALLGLLNLLRTVAGGDP